MQDSDISEKQLKLILQADMLLDDHAALIQSFLKKNCRTLWETIVQWLPSTLSTTASILSIKCNNIITLTLGFPVAIIFAYRIYEKYCSSKHLKNLISAQNELFHLCKNTLKILRYRYRMKMLPAKFGQKFLEMGSQKLKYLQPLMETVLKSMQDASRLYYRTSLIIGKLLPTTIPIESLITIFDNKKFMIVGEVTYDALKHLYYVYILAQSDMLYTLATAYYKDTWLEHGTLPEAALSQIILNVHRPLKGYCTKLSKIIRAYRSNEVDLVRRPYRGIVVPKWQDLYVQLDLTLQKIQLTYQGLASILENIDIYSETNINDKELTEIIMKKLNEVCKEMDTARNFTEFSSLLLAKMQHTQSKEIHNEENLFDKSIAVSELPTFYDAEPEVIDEVFEEYINEEYLKPLYQDSEFSSLNYKLDKLLAKNLMSELKEVLVEKHREMSERESKALQRMYNSISKKSSLELQCNQSTNTSSMEVPVPLPRKKRISVIQESENNFNQFPESGLDICGTQNSTICQELKQPPVPPPLPRKNIFSTSNIQAEDDLDIHKENISKMSADHIVQSSPNFPSMSKSEELGSSENLQQPPLSFYPPKLGTTKDDIPCSPFSIPVDRTGLRPFFQLSEETFVGSGENTESVSLSDIEEDDIHQ
ncbi:uncharacterized protein LOC105698147 isoform X2 [Orussus abietinus]|nr:uncharacterized protein LOC105698147 isoform X2 [Orussus abietinus]